ncbi:MAG: hypothetical protein AABX69_03430, partial [Nanoarchaeota archaeon]
MTPEASDRFWSHPVLRREKARHFRLCQKMFGSTGRQLRVAFYSFPAAKERGVKRPIPCGEWLKISGEISMADDLTYKRLRDLAREEKAQPSLVKLPQEFYSSIGEFLSSKFSEMESSRSVLQMREFENAVGTIK